MNTWEMLGHTDLSYKRNYIIYLLTVIVLTAGASSTVYMYTQTILRTTHWDIIQNRTHINIRISKYNNKIT